MFTRDFVMRQIQQLSQVLALVLMKKRLKQPEEAREVISQGMNDALESDLDQILLLNREDTIDLCKKNGHFVSDLAVSIADLLKEDGSGEALERSAWLYKEALTHGGTLPLSALTWLEDHS